ncbi:NUDIX domain-containing protein [Streptomyces sp. NPDC057521]|uniref:NUDIX hydrolase n=1 Tax=Streptomyces sp. NPDC057521 TaxID=3346156 RepID=UPI0036BF3E00
MAAAKQCDGTSVGVILCDEYQRFAIFDRGTAPAGAAWVAGHIDQHGSSEQAAVQESWEELGVRVRATELVKIGQFWRLNHCRRTPYTRPQDGAIGHRWTLFQANIRSTVLSPSDREARNARWVGTSEIQSLTNRTIAWARGEISNEAFAACPGVEPVWISLAMSAGIVRVDAGDLAVVEQRLNDTLHLG